MQLPSNSPVERIRHRLPVLHDQTDAEFVSEGWTGRGAQGRYSDGHRLADWHVWADGLRPVLCLLPLFGAMAAVNSPAFWFTMQIAMLAGFITSYPVNWWLIKVGIKERM